MARFPAKLSIDYYLNQNKELKRVEKKLVAGPSPSTAALPNAASSIPSSSSSSIAVDRNVLLSQLLEKRATSGLTRFYHLLLLNDPAAISQLAGHHLQADYLVDDQIEDNEQAVVSSFFFSPTVAFAIWRYLN